MIIELRSGFLLFQQHGFGGVELWFGSSAHLLTKYKIRLYIF